VFAANGSNEVLQTLLLAYAGPGRRVATFEPTYQLHGHIARLTGATVIEGERGPTSRCRCPLRWNSSGRAGPK
jgi:histidinol-phosphate aminotransferase